MMFTSDKEGLSATLVDIKLTAGLLGFNNNQTDREIEAQIFPAHDDFSERVRKSCYYGKLPPTDRPSLPLTQLAVEQFSMVGLQKLSRLDIARAADMSRDACASPTSLVFSLIYLDRLKRRNPDYLRSVSSADLFLVSMMVASKFLYDDGEEDEVFNDEWAKSGQMEVKDFNKLEVEFLSAIDWNVNVPTKEFDSALKRIEQEIAYREFTRRDWATYSDLEVLSHAEGVAGLWKYLADLAVRMTTVCMAAYAASIFTLIGSTALLNQTPFGPDGVATSYRSLCGRRESVVAAPTADTTSGQLVMHGSPTSEIGQHAFSSSNFSDSAAKMASFAHRDSIQPDMMNLSPAELLTASMLVASIKSSRGYEMQDEQQPSAGGWTTLDHRGGWDSYDRGGGGGSWDVNDTDSSRLNSANETETTTTYVPAWILERTEFIPHATDSRSGGGEALFTKIFDFMTSKISRRRNEDDRVPELHSPDSASWFLGALDDQDFVDEEEERVRSLALEWSKSVWRQLTSQHNRDDQDYRSSQQCPLRTMFRSNRLHPAILDPLPVSVF